MYMMSALSYGPTGREGSVSMAYGAYKKKDWKPSCQSEKYAFGCELTWRKPAMKVLGSVALGSSSARKYLRTCESCFQKLRVSYRERFVLDYNVLWPCV